MLTSGMATCPCTADVSDVKFAAHRAALAASTRKLSSCGKEEAHGYTFVGLSAGSSAVLLLLRSRKRQLYICKMLCAMAQMSVMTSSTAELQELAACLR